MPRYRHPRVDPDDPRPFAVQLPKRKVTLDDDGCFDAEESEVRALASAYDTTPADMAVGDTETMPYEEAKAFEEHIERGDGCPWCSEYDGDSVGAHASSAHPDEWEAYKDARGDN